MAIHPMTDADRAGEAEMLRICADAWECEITAYPEYHQIDWYAHEGKNMIAHVELKTRFYRTGAHPTFMFAAHKFAALMSQYLVTGVRGVIVARLDDAQLWTYADTAGIVAVEHFRRPGRADQCHPVAYLAWDTFEPISKGRRP